MVVVPRDPNPYQEQLYGHVRAAGVAAVYLTGPTASHTANVALRPLHLLWLRLRGFGVLHVHWVYDFVPPWLARVRGGRRVAEWWFGVTLMAAKVSGMRVVWTAHNVLPHEPVFANDERARRRLARCANAVLVHASSTARHVRALGARDVRVVPQGTYGRVPRAAAARRQARAALGIGDAKALVNVGLQRPYKGTDALLTALAGIDDPVLVLVGGHCPDEAWRDRLHELGSACGSRARVCLRHLDDAELRQWLCAADVAVFPFRSVTNSSSVLRALGSGIPVVVPDLEALSDLPADAVFRYDPGDGLSSIVREVIALPDEALEAKAAAAVRFGLGQTWAAAAAATVAAYRGTAPAAPTGPIPSTAPPAPIPSMARNRPADVAGARPPRAGRQAAAAALGAAGPAAGSPRAPVGAAGKSAVAR